MKANTKITVILSSTIICVTLLISGLIYYSLNNYVNEEFYNLLEYRAKIYAKTNIEGNNIPIKELKNNATVENEHDIVFKINDIKDLQINAKTYNLNYSFLRQAYLNNNSEYTDQNIMYKAITYTNQKNDKYIIIAYAKKQSTLQSHIGNRLIIIIIASIFISFIIALLLRKSIFKPIQSITEKVKQIGSENLHLRLESVDSKDEISELIKTFNNMLSRIETAFETQNNFISNASHELKTPLTAIIGQADVALSKIRPTEQYIESLQIILEETDKLQNKTNALLSLAQTGFNGKMQKFESISVIDLIKETISVVEKLDPNHRVILDLRLISEETNIITIIGNNQLLQLALSNIITNSSKYSNYKEVIVSVGTTDKNIFIVVKDLGIGIPKDEIKYIYDPFFRASNTNNFDGFGIGLPLTRNIIKLHNGELLIESTENQGTTVQVKIPLTKV